MCQVLSKDIIEKEMIPLIPRNKSGPLISVPLAELINCILYKLKTGIQWEYLPIGSLFSEKALHYKTVFGHYRKWCKQGFWKDCWVQLLSKHRSKPDLSSSDLDGSHTTALKGGEQVGCQGRKKRKTTNALYQIISNIYSKIRKFKEESIIKYDKKYFNELKSESINRISNFSNPYIENPKEYNYKVALRPFSRDIPTFLVNIFNELPNKDEIKDYIENTMTKMID